MYLTASNKFRSMGILVCVTVIYSSYRQTLSSWFTCLPPELTAKSCHQGLCWSIPAWRLLSRSTRLWELTSTFQPTMPEPYPSVKRVASLLPTGSGISTRRPQILTATYSLDELELVCLPPFLLLPCGGCFFSAPYFYSDACMQACM